LVRRPANDRPTRRLIAGLSVVGVISAPIVLEAVPASADDCTYDAGTQTVTFAPGGQNLYGDGPICGQALDQIATVILAGTSGDDTFWLDVVGGVFTPGAGADPDGSPEVKLQLDGGGGSDTITFYGVSTLTYDFVFSGQGLDLNGDGDADLSFSNVENVAFRLGTGDDVVDASAGIPTGMTDVRIEDGPGHDTITGGPEDDWLNPWDGDDDFSGGMGNDTVDVMSLASNTSFDLGSWDGGGGEDTLVFEERVIADLSLDTARESGGFPPKMTFSGFEDLTAMESGSTLIGDGGHNVLQTPSGGLLRGAGGDDTLVGNSSSVADFGDAGQISVDLAGGTASGDGNDTLVGIENVVGSPGNDTMHGDDDHSSIVLGEGGDDAISGGPVEDLLIGGAGRDDLRGGDGPDDLHGGPGGDLMIGGLGDDDFSGGSGRDDIRGGPGTDGWNASFFSITEQDEPPTEGASVDLRTGVVGDDGFGTTDAISGIEDASGTFFADRLIGDDGDNILFGSSGNDRIVGGPGDDDLDAGTGRDTVSYAAASHAVDVDLTAHTATGLGHDTLEGIEVVIGGPDGDLLRGSAADQRLEGHGGNDVLLGRGGGDALAGGPGADAMDGGEGHDTCNGGDGHEDTAKECETVWRVP
jgi:Ca2+-binding RTX toxin-like protein